MEASKKLKLVHICPVEVTIDGYEQADRVALLGIYQAAVTVLNGRYEVAGEKIVDQPGGTFMSRVGRTARILAAEQNITPDCLPVIQAAVICHSAGCELDIGNVGVNKATLASV